MATRHMLLSALRVRRSIPVDPAAALAVARWARSSSTTSVTPAPAPVAHPEPTTDAGPARALTALEEAEESEPSGGFDEFYKALMELPARPKAQPKAEAIVRNQPYLKEVERILKREGVRYEGFLVADQYVQTIEQGRTRPDVAIYLTLFQHHHHHALPRHLAIDLFRRIRLVSYPQPPLSIWNAILRSYAHGRGIQAEPVLDLFQELKDSGAPGSGLEPDVETYAHVVRGLCQSREQSRDEVGHYGTSDSSKWYAVALRLVRGMIGEGVTPNREIFMALLKGAKRNKDLGRAKGFYRLIADSLRDSKLSPTEAAEIEAPVLTDLLQAYASFKDFTGDRSLAHYPASMDALPDTLSVRDDGRPESSTTAVSTPTLDRSEDLATLPQTRKELIAEVEALMAPHFARLAKDPVISLPIPQQRGVAFAHAAYVAVYSAHATLRGCANAFEASTFMPYDTWSAPKNTSKAPRITWTYSILLRRCERDRSSAVAAVGAIARKAFKEWRNSLAWQQRFEQVASAEAKQAADVWAAWLRILAKLAGPKDALRAFREFVSLYPPFRHVQVPPLHSRDLRVVRLRLREAGDREGLAYLDSELKKLAEEWTRRDLNRSEMRRRARGRVVQDQIIHVDKYHKNNPLPPPHRPPGARERDEQESTPPSTRPVTHPTPPVPPRTLTGRATLPSGVATSG